MIVRKRYITSLSILLFIIVLTGCSFGNSDFNRDNLSFVSADRAVNKISELAYDKEKHEIGRIYLLENNEYIPYLVVDKDYQGNVLLIRENVRDEEVPFYGKMKDVSVHWHEVYYGNSFIDYYLNHRFLEDFTKNMQGKIQNVDIEVYNSRDKNFNEDSVFDPTTSVIQRKVFLLSQKEVTGSGYRKTGEGERIDFFAGKHLGTLEAGSMREAADKNDISMPWMLRTADLTADASLIYIQGNRDDFGHLYPCGKVMENNVVGQGGFLGATGVGGFSYTDNQLILRPAFTVRPTEKVIRVDNKKGEKIFALEEKEERPLNNIANVKTIKDLSTDSSDYINKVHINENGEFVPFLVLSKYENTNDILLLRDKPFWVTRGAHFNNYDKDYKGSFLDTYLDTMYINSFSTSLRDRIISEDIDTEIGKDLKKINRHIFALSSEEICGGTEFFLKPLGQKQEFFKKVEHRQVDSMEPLDAWMLRDFNSQGPMGVNRLGSIVGLRSTINYDDFLVRPAFCLDQNTEVITKNGQYYLQDF